MIFPLSSAAAPSCFAPCLLCNVIIFLSRGVTFIKDAGAGAASCQSLEWVLEFQSRIARGKSQRFLAGLPLILALAYFFCPAHPSLFLPFYLVCHWSVAVSQTCSRSRIWKVKFSSSVLWYLLDEAFLHLRNWINAVSSINYLFELVLNSLIRIHNIISDFPSQMHRNQVATVTLIALSNSSS